MLGLAHLQFVHGGKNDEENQWYQFVLPNRKYMFIYLNKDGKSEHTINYYQ